MADEPPPPPPGPPPGLDRAPAQPAAAYPSTAAHPSHDAYAQAYSAYYASAGYAAQPSGAAAPPAGAAAAAPPPPPPGQAPPAGGHSGYDYSQYYQQYPYGYDYSQYYAQQGYHGYTPPAQGQAAAPPPPAPAAATAPSAAAPARPGSAGRRMVTLQRARQQAQQAPPPPAAGVQSYNAVPPPAAIGSGGRRGGASAMRQMQHQHAYARPAAPGATSLVGVAQAAAAALSAGQQPPPRPAYTAVGAYQPKTKAPALNPASWPPAVKSYVERAFKAAPARERSKLQEVLKIVINDAQEKGELFTRGWDALPLPDLTQSAGDAAAIILEIAEVAGPGGVGSGGGAAAPWRGASLQRLQQQHQYMDAQHQQQQQSKQRQRGGKSAVGMVREKFSEGPSGRGGKSQRGRKRGRWDQDPYNNDTDDYVALSGSDDDASQGGPLPADEESRRRRRQGRFGDGAADGAAPKSASARRPTAAARRAALAALLDADPAAGDDVDWDAFAIKGTCTNLEKSYFRLTSAPDPSTVRPEQVLRAALNRLVRLIASGEVNYFYAADQFKGLRQDCVVQGLKGPLALAVYESHARAALEYGDVAEYNQCQGQIDALWTKGVRSEGKCENEFLAARILYQTVHARHGEALALLHTLKTVGPAEREAPEVSHALGVRVAMAAGDAARFFELYAEAPGLGRALMDLAVTRVRFEALMACVKAYKPTLPVSFLARLLGFVRKEGGGGSGGGKEKKEVERTEPLPGCASLVFEGANAAQGAEEGRIVCMAWLAECGAVVTGEGADAAVDCKASTGQLQMPPEKEKVAHGDANLDIGDFLKSFGDGE